MIKSISIGGRRLGEGYPCFVIAEAGVNHNGSIKLAKKLVDVAKDAGADAVKFQTFRAEDVVVENVPMASYQKRNTKKSETQFRMLKRLELDYENFVKLKEYCDKRKIIFLSTPHSLNAAEFLDSLVPAYKIASGDLTNIYFLRKIAEKKKPIILSTGMAAMREVGEAVATVRRYNCKFVLLHCTTDYPCSLDDVNLRAMVAMRDKFRCLVGYSDHTLSQIVPVVAVTLGAVIIEKHFTLDKKFSGPDHKASFEPEELKKMIDNIRRAEKAMGRDKKKPAICEIKIKRIVRKSVVAACNIKRGEVLTPDKLAIKRPEGGIPPRDVDKVVGKKARRSIRKDTLLTWDMLSGA